MTIWSISPCCASALDNRSSPSDRSSIAVPKCVIHGVDCPSRRGPLGTRGVESQIQSACGRDEGPLCPCLVIMFKIHHVIFLVLVDFFSCIYSQSGSHSSNIPPSSAMRIDSNVSSKYLARSALSALGTGRSRVSGLRCAMKRKVVSSEPCPTRLHEPPKLSDPS